MSKVKNLNEENGINATPILEEISIDFLQAKNESGKSFKNRDSK
jgi:hypothetical protein